MSEGLRGETREFATKAALAAAASAFVAETIISSVEARGSCSVALAGGNTPKDVYSLLADEPLRGKVPWGVVNVLFGDERCVPPDDPRSNYGMAYEALFSKVPVKNTFRIRGEAEPHAAAAEYEKELERVFGTELPRLDLVLLGMGADGHTASLFPGTSSLSESQKPAAAVWVPQVNAWRVTLTFPVLNAAREILVMVSGREKAETLARVAASRSQDERLPVTLLNPPSGKLRWFLDADAAQFLPEKTRRKGNS